MVRGKGEEAGIRKFADGLCYGGRVDTEPGGKVGRLHRPVAFRNIPEVGNFPGGKAQTVMDLHEVSLSGDPLECLVCIQILFLWNTRLSVEPRIQGLLVAHRYTSWVKNHKKL